MLALATQYKVICTFVFSGDLVFYFYTDSARRSHTQCPYTHDCGAYGYFSCGNLDQWQPRGVGNGILAGGVATSGRLRWLASYRMHGSQTVSPKDLAIL